MTNQNNTTIKIASGNSVLDDDFTCYLSDYSDYSISSDPSSLFIPTWGPSGGISTNTPFITTTSPSINSIGTNYNYFSRMEEFNPTIIELVLTDGTKLIRRLDFNMIKELREKTDDDGKVYTTIIFNNIMTQKDDFPIDVACSASAIMTALKKDYERFASYSMKSVLNNGE